MELYRVLPLWVRVDLGVMVMKCYSTFLKAQSSEDKVIHTFLKSIGPKVNLIDRLEFELAYYDVAVEYISHYATGTLTLIFVSSVYFSRSSGASRRFLFFLFKTIVICK